VVANSIVIERDLKTVWAKIEAEFCKTFNSKDKDLLGKKVSIKTKNYMGSPIEVAQVVTEYKPEQSITIQSLNQNDVVTSQYSVEAVDTGSCRVVLSVEGKNQGSLLKTWNYWVMSLPVFRGGTKKRLAMQLNRLKAVIEEGDGSS